MNEFKKIWFDTQSIQVDFHIASEDDYNLIPIILWLREELTVNITVEPELASEFINLLNIKIKSDLIYKEQPVHKTPYIIYIDGVALSKIGDR